MEYHYCEEAAALAAQRSAAQQCSNSASIGVLPRADIFLCSYKLACQVVNIKLSLCIQVLLTWHLHQLSYMYIWHMVKHPIMPPALTDQFSAGPDFFSIDLFSFVDEYI